MEQPSRDVVAAVTAFLQQSGVAFREVAAGEWGLAVDGANVGLRLSGGLLRAQCWAAPPGVHDAHRLLHANRLGALARYAHSSGGDVWVQAEIPEAAAGDADALDRMLGAVVEARARLVSGAGSAGGAERSWASPSSE
ncbi:MAG TPA: hypothetical protein VFG42_00220 [Baekduia sp.]|uniref:hypothetical protein n=1 Tax=Baekduia sp. TaxID=2600305 RepID=UPI002D7A1C0F|nr:hypothetical protein [Baekduia sp.]HET6505184.1 hypothetical protein [Baekduia sp.]